MLLNRRGIFSFIILIVAAELILTELQVGIANEKTLAEAKAIAFEIETVNLKRFEIEQNLDALIEAEIREGIAAKNNREQIEDAIASAIVNFCENYPAQNNLEIGFYLTADNFEKYSDLVNAKSLYPVNKEELKKNFTVLPELIAGEEIVITFIYHGARFSERKLLIAKIKTTNYEQVFILPFDYTKTVSVLI